MDDFAQTREADDLFESEISTPQLPPPSAPTEPRAFATRGRGQGRSGSSRGGGYKGGTPRITDRNAPKDSPGVEGAPEGPAADSEDAIKQDRTLSGGVIKPKLTEEELAERLERAKKNNERLIERRRKALEDESSFQAQEAARKQADATKRIVERKKKVEHEKNKKELDDEREKNRQRKLSAVNTREWDSTKTEEDYNPRKQSSQFRRGAQGGVSDSRGASHDAPRDSPDDTPHDYPQQREDDRGNNRGVRRGGHRRGGSRGTPTGPRSTRTGPHTNALTSRGTPSKSPATTQEWPDLPSAAKDKTTTKDETPAAKAWPPTNDQLTAAKNLPSVEEKPSADSKVPEKAKLHTGDHTKDTLSPLSPAIDGGSWAEQVESAS